MRTCHIHRYGGPAQLHLGELPEPALMPDAVRIEVHAAGLNPVDFKTRDGKVKLLLPYRMPLILGNELCGEVIEVGERVAKGDAGGFAEIAVVPAALLAKVPDTVNDTNAGQDHQHPAPAADFDGTVRACALTEHVPFGRVSRSLGSSRSSLRRGLRQHT